jgi:hypothetical protein
MSVKAGWSTPMFPVTEVEQSIEFYALLGFETIDTEGSRPIAWARLHSVGGAIMLLRADYGHVVKPAEPGVILYMYVPDLPAFRVQLIKDGMNVPAITYPGYMPSGELTLLDPDGYHVSVGHWGEKEHQVWLKKIGTERVERFRDLQKGTD